MAIYNLGSINADHVYRVSHMPEPGETLAAKSFQVGLGGKGTNQSVAAARAHSTVYHIGAVGPDGRWAKERLGELGVDCSYVAEIATPTGHAIINVDDSAENSIVLFQGANFAMTTECVEAALTEASGHDTLLLQNETAHQVHAAKLARSKGMRVIYSAAPFSVEAVKAVLPYVTMIAVNEIEAEQLSAALETNLSRVPVDEILVTRGAKGAEWRRKDRIETVQSFDVSPVDTTAAGDTFAGYFAAALDQGEDVKMALRLASAAAALKVTKTGAADGIPSRTEVDAFLSENG